MKTGVTFQWKSMPPTTVGPSSLANRYEDQTSRPAFLEYGVLKETGELWVDVFDNREVALTFEEKAQEE